MGVGGEKDVFPLLVKDCVQLQETPETTESPPRENLLPFPAGPEEGRAGVAPEEPAGPAVPWLVARAPVPLCGYQRAEGGRRAGRA